MGFFNNIFGDSSNKDTNQNSLNWNELTDLKQLDAIASESSQIPVIIFKHSTRCGISRMSLKGFESEYAIDQDRAKPYFLDLLNYREISNAIAEKFGVYHESPQLLLIKNGKAVYYESHGGISADEVAQRL
ncbi:bacillithiol system redox-active protein YtxJ [Flavobacterium sp. MAH-1]|uniref:Bacillithiol system redox-active protein YtxJ n=1 Tax=Flavobacterium agri TaxID=2743471 RepID=A0A7Y8Y492_9FLAO|nr:bacillithiol system redox-active protein YtxJ [Flavobacterium agri]NUY82299.1 bacillithiol system redox-active protein YtxJ [Flavobacterium agri]NYA72323.1 bacillithiol system redox-active protein YtxJ [Flavobacterium agri]